MKTILKDRTLWYDGTLEVNPEDVPLLILSGVPPTDIVVTHLNDDINLYNSLSDITINVNKLSNNPFDLTWDIPQEFQNINLTEFLEEKCSDYCKAHNKNSEKYFERLYAELVEIKQRDIEMLFKTICFLLHRLRQTNTVWGVGRGSSCASLVLFLLGLHKVDPIKYDISIEEFFH